MKYTVVLILLLITLSALVINGLALNEANQFDSALFESIKDYRAYTGYLQNRINELEAEVEAYKKICSANITVTIEEIPIPIH